MKPVFVSYSQPDEALARELSKTLVEHGFKPLLTDDAGARASDSDGDLRQADAVVLLIGADPSRGARREWSEALRVSWNEDRELPIIPVLLDGARTPTFLQDRMYLRVSVDEGWEEVARAVESHSGLSEESTPATAERLYDRLTELRKTVDAASDQRSEPG